MTKSSGFSLNSHLNGGGPSFDGEGFEPHKSRYRWVILILLWLLYCSFGLVFRSIFPLITPILKDLSISYTQMGIILGSWQLTYILAALVAGSILDKWGVHKSILAGAMIIGLSGTLRYFPKDFATMLIAVALFGAGGPLISIGGPKTISEWFSGRSRGTAVGLYMTGPWLGGLLALSLTNSLVMPLTGYSWRLTFVCYGLLTFAVGFLWWFLARATRSIAATESTGMMEVFRRLIRVRNVKILLLMALFSFAIGHGFSSWLPKILEISGMSASRAGFAASIPLAAGIPAVIVVPRLVPPHLRGRFIAFFALLTTLNIMVVVNASSTLLTAGLILLGIGNSSFMPLMILILMDSPEVGTRHMGSAGGLFFCVAEIGGSTGPLIMGFLVDVTGAFMVGAIFLASLCIGIFTMAFFLKSQPLSDPKIS
jgi:cyanate permease